MAGVDLRALMETPKTVAIKPVWDAPDSIWFKCTVALDIDGVTVPGLELRGTAGQTLPDRSVSFHLQHHPPREECVHLARVDWRPLGSHTNPESGPRKLRLLRVEGSHIHGFDNNWLADSERLRMSIPVAELLDPDPASFEELVARVGKEFRIRGLDRLERPNWRMSDLFGV